MMTLLDFLNAKTYSGAGKIYVSPDIPKKLLSNAVSAYAPHVDPSEVLVLIDDTVFGSGKDGALVTADELVVKEIFTDPAVYPFDRMQAISGQGNKVYAGKKAIMTLNVPAKEDVQVFFTLLGKWAAGRDQAGDVPDAQASAGTTAVGSELTDEQVEQLAEAILVAAQRLAPERVFVQPHIPPKKLQAALASYGGNLAADDVLVLVDDTLFGSAKEGLLLARETLALKMVFDTPRLFFWRHTQELHVEKRDLFVNSRKIGSLTQLGSKELTPFLNAINQALDAIRATSAGPSSPSLPVEPASVERVIAEPKASPVPAIAPVSKLPVEVEDTRVQVLESLDQPDKPGSKDKILGYVASAIEQNKSKIIPFLKEKTGEASLAAIRDDANVEKLASFLYAFLPGVVRLALKGQVFVRFMLDNRDKLLEKLLQNESLSRELLLTNDARPRTFDDELDELLGETVPVASGRDVLARFKALDQTIRKEAAGEDDEIWMYKLPITFLNLILRRLEKLEAPAQQVEAQVLSVLSIIYGFSFHKIPEQVRQEENVFQAYFMGYMMLCERYEQTPGATVDTEAECLPVALGLAKMVDRQTLNKMVRQLLENDSSMQQAGYLGSEDILALLREANHFAEKWFEALASKVLEEEREIQRKWGDLLG